MRWPLDTWVPFVHRGSSDLPCGAVFLYGERSSLRADASFALDHFRTPSGVPPSADEELRCPRCQESTGADLFQQIRRLVG